MDGEMRDGLPERIGAPLPEPGSPEAPMMEEDMNDPDEPAESVEEPDITSNLRLSARIREYTPLLRGRPVLVHSAKDARRLFSRLIMAFQRGEIENRDAKDRSYLLTGFLQSCVSAILEARVEQLENPGVRRETE